MNIWDKSASSVNRGYGQSMQYIQAVLAKMEEQILCLQAIIPPLGMVVGT